MVEPTDLHAIQTRVQNPSRSPPLLDARFFDQPADAVDRVNHWMRLPLVKSSSPKSRKVCLMLRLNLAGGIQDRAGCCCRHRRVFHHREHGFVTQRAAAEQATNVFCCGCRRARTSAINGWFRVSSRDVLVSHRRASPLLVPPLGAASKL